MLKDKQELAEKEENEKCPKQRDVLCLGEAGSVGTSGEPDLEGS